MIKTTLLSWQGCQIENRWNLVHCLNLPDLPPFLRQNFLLLGQCPKFGRFLILQPSLSISLVFYIVFLLYIFKQFSLYIGFSCAQPNEFINSSVQFLKEIHWMRPTEELWPKDPSASCKPQKVEQIFLHPSSLCFLSDLVRLSA